MLLDVSGYQQCRSELIRLAQVSELRAVEGLLHDAVLFNGEYYVYRVTRGGKHMASEVLLTRSARITAYMYDHFVDGVSDYPECQVNLSWTWQLLYVNHCVWDLKTGELLNASAACFTWMPVPLCLQSAVNEIVETCT